MYIQRTVHIETTMLYKSTWEKSEALVSHGTEQEVRHQIFIFSSRAVSFQHVVHKRGCEAVVRQGTYSGFPY